MIVDLTGKQAIVTGSTAGIGFAIAEGLAKAGARVVVTGRTQAAVDSAVEAINIGLEAPRAAGVAGAARGETAAGVTATGGAARRDGCALRR